MRRVSSLSKKRNTAVADSVEAVSETGLRRGDGTVVGIAVILLTVAMMALADAIVKYASSDMPLWQIFVVRSLIAIPIIAAAAFFKALPLRPASLGWTLLRSLFLALMYIAIYAVAPVLKLSTIAASLYTGPLFITLFSAYLIGEPVGLVRWLAIVMGFAGVLIIIRPATDAVSLAALIPVLAAILYALAAIVTRSKCVDESPVVLALALNYVLLAVGLVFTLTIGFVFPASTKMSAYPFLLGHWVTMGSREWGLISVLAVLIIGIGIGLAKAYQSGPPAVIATFDYGYLIFAAFWGFLFFGTAPDAAECAGMALIVLSGVLVMNSGHIARRLNLHAS
jgi:drug/metabolite transporter (DMT)-like permease